MLLFRPKSLAAAMVLGVTLATVPALAADQAPAAAAGHTARKINAAEARIKDLHDKLHVTAAQTEQWNAVAQVMRDNVKTHDALVRDKLKDAATMTAVDDLRAYQAIAEAHADGVRKLTAAFEAFYAMLSPEQKKAADEEFRAHKRRHSLRATH